jgi:formimidoylglutamate deiminase
VNATTDFWAPHAWLQGRWAENVLLRVDAATGCWADITAGVPTPPPGATVLQGPVLPPLIDVHSHAFQRAFAGLAERRTPGHKDDFWSWRDRMYAVALRITPAQLRAVAAHLYVELLRGGYTQVCEFHYLQHREDGTPYPGDGLAMSWALADAAADAGIGLTVLPVLYERAGFAQDTLRPDQRRFATTADGVWAMQQAIAGARRPLVNAGVAIHSLRAARPDSIHRLRELADAANYAGPIHIHVAEQMQEVQDCLHATGARPVQWLAHEGLLDARWQLVHATHVTPDEIASAAAAGAGAVLCPSTEANLGDGLTDVPRWLQSNAPLTIGSDSHVTRAWREELRLLEYGQRLALRQRNVCADPEGSTGHDATAARLFDRVTSSPASARAAGFDRWGFTPGARADLLVIDLQDHALLGVPTSHLLDALVFSSPGRPWRDVMVAGRMVIEGHRHGRAQDVGAAFAKAMGMVWVER